MYWITGILGLGLMVAPFVFGYSDNSLALWTSLLLGGAVVFVSYFERFERGKETWEYTFAGFVGLAAILAPIIFRYSDHAGAFWTSMIVGILLMVIGGFKYYDKKTTYW